MSRLWAVVCATALAAGAVAAVPAVAFATDSGNSIPLSVFQHIAVDDANGYVFLDGGGSNGIAVRDASGAGIKVIHGEPGADGMTVSADGSTLYVALQTADAISVIDTSTLTETTRVHLGADTCPASVAALGSTVWFGYGCDEHSGIGALDVSGTPSAHLAAATGFVNPPILAVSPGLPGRIFAAIPGLTPSTVQSFDVSGTTLTAGPMREVGENLRDMAVTADGADLITASGSPYIHPAYRTSDLGGDGHYGSNNPYPIAVATSADGFVAAGVYASYDPDVYVYTRGGTLRHKYDFGTGTDVGKSTQLAPAGLAFNADGSRLYAVTTDYLGGTVRLHVFVGATGKPTHIALSAPAHRPRAKHLTIHGTLHGAANAAVTVTKHDLDGTHTLHSVHTNSAGAFTITDTPRVGGKNTYAVHYHGDPAHSAASKSVSVDVSRAKSTLSIKTSRHTYGYGAKVRVTAHLGHTYRSRTVSIYVKPHGQKLILARRGKVDRHGNLTASGRVDRNTTFRAVFDGDERYAPARTDAVRKVHAHVKTAISGNYGKSGQYALFHAGDKAYLGASIAPGKSGEQVHFPLQEYSSGHWHTVVNNAFPLNDNSVVLIYFTGRTGYRYRVRAVYKGDRANLGVQSRWRYAEFG
jgi:YVTN family beta-propeller protein